MAGSRGDNSKCGYRGIIYEVAQELSTENARDISFLAAISAQQDGCCCDHHHHHGTSPRPQLALLELMERRGLFSENDLEPLMLFLREIGRDDLASKCDGYHQLPQQHIIISEDVDKDNIINEGIETGLQQKPNTLSEHKSIGNHTPPTPPTSHTPSLPISPSVYKSIRNPVQPTSSTPTPPTSHTPSSPTSHTPTSPCCVLALTQRKLFHCNKLTDLSQKIRCVFHPNHRHHHRHHNNHNHHHHQITKSFSSDDYIFVDSSMAASTAPQRASSVDMHNLGDSLVGGCHGRQGRSREMGITELVGQEVMMSSLPCGSTHFGEERVIAPPTSSLLNSSSSPSLSSSLPLEFTKTPTFTWKLKRADLIGCINHHDNKSITTRFRVVGGSHDDHIGYTCTLTLYPNGINWDLDTSATLKVEVKQNHTSPTHTSSQLYFNVLGVAHGLVTEVVAQRETVLQCKDKHTFVLNEFISHDVMRISESDVHLVFHLSLQYQLGKDWVCLGGEEEEEEEGEGEYAEGNEYFIVPHFP